MVIFFLLELIFHLCMYIVKLWALMFEIANARNRNIAYIVFGITSMFFGMAAAVLEEMVTSLFKEKLSGINL